MLVTIISYQKIKTETSSKVEVDVICVSCFPKLVAGDTKILVFRVIDKQMEALPGTWVHLLVQSVDLTMK